jgi:hypothetical protein
VIGFEPRLDSEGASRPTLIGTTFAYRNRQRIALELELKLPAMTRCIPGGHHREP